MTQPHQTTQHHWTTQHSLTNGQDANLDSTCDLYVMTLLVEPPGLSLADVHVCPAYDVSWLRHQQPWLDLPFAPHWTHPSPENSTSPPDPDPTHHHDLPMNHANATTNYQLAVEETETRTERLCWADLVEWP